MRKLVVKLLLTLVAARIVFSTTNVLAEDRPDVDPATQMGSAAGGQGFSRKPAKDEEDQKKEVPTQVLRCDDKFGGVDKESSKLVLSLSDVGAACTQSVPDDYAFELRDVKLQFRITATPGDVVSGVIRGVDARGDENPTVTFEKGKFANHADVTFTVRTATGELVATQKIKLLHRYRINLAVGIIAGNGATTYSIANKVIQENEQGFDVTYTAMFHLYLASRVFDDSFDTPCRRFSLVAGFEIAHPTDGLFIGLGWEPTPGLTFVAGWHPRRVSKLRPGVAVGTTNGDATIPTDTIWNGNFWGAGLSIDTNIAKAITAAFK